jgi:dienelactone hydrolase
VLAEQAVPEWQATLDALLELDGLAGPVGYWGISMGGGIGVPLVADEPRITAAVLGLAGHEILLEAAGRISVPVEFLLQWDDEMVGRDEGLTLFDAFASREKTLHANPGPHAGVPTFELESSTRFFTRHLVPWSSGLSRADPQAGHDEPHEHDNREAKDQNIH